MNNHSSHKKNIAYLGPEIPAISMTFVYNEILGLEEKDLNVFIYSVHYPVVMAEEPNARSILSRTQYLYNLPKYKFILFPVIHLITNFRNFIITAAKLLHDIFSLKKFSLDWIKLVYHFFIGSYLAYQLKKNKIFHLQIHFANVPAQIGMYAAGLAGIPFTFTAHANDIFERGLLLKEKADRAKRLITISEYNKRFLISKGINPGKISIVRCGVKPVHGIDNKQRNVVPVIGSLGRLVEKKGMDILISACALLKKEGIKFRLEIAGDGPLLNNLKLLAESMKISNMVEFKGALRHDLVFEWLESIDVFALACKQDKNGDADGIPVVLMEAMAHHVPVVSTFITGVPELIQHEKTGLLSPPENVESLYMNLKKILTENDLRKRLVNEAGKWIEKEFGQDVNIERIYKIIMGKGNLEK
ncbi:MAG: colanic acid biosynthesis glycosyltransferase WcaL [Spirochaetae bacterium HGW-Spirochaetae-1]|jgi:glycosyltransferase involved in cell wall biosynthesis|nr:MAG: colanic acid biosynthesis glycosyltransferase WcaL [Spirochaetae bacterium HGW-Spirochaetae-1]